MTSFVQVFRSNGRNLPNQPPPSRLGLSSSILAPQRGRLQQSDSSSVTRSLPSPSNTTLYCFSAIYDQLCIPPPPLRSPRTDGPKSNGIRSSSEIIQETPEPWTTDAPSLISQAPERGAPGQTRARVLSSLPLQRRHLILQFVHQRLQSKILRHQLHFRVEFVALKARKDDCRELQKVTGSHNDEYRHQSIRGL